MGCGRNCEKVISLEKYLMKRYRNSFNTITHLTNSLRVIGCNGLEASLAMSASLRFTE